MGCAFADPHGDELAEGATAARQGARRRSDRYQRDQPGSAPSALRSRRAAWGWRGLGSPGAGTASPGTRSHHLRRGREHAAWQRERHNNLPRLARRALFHAARQHRDRECDAARPDERLHVELVAPTASARRLQTVAPRPCAAHIEPPAGLPNVARVPWRNLRTYASLFPRPG